MKYYIDPVANKVYAYELDGSQDALIREGMVAMTPDQVAAHINPPKTQDQVAAEFVGAIQARLDAFAKTRNYDGILSACTYAASGVPRFAAEGHACVNLRDATWSAAYVILASVQAGTRPMPSSIADIEVDLPQLFWPT